MPKEKPYSAGVGFLVFFHGLFQVVLAFVS